MITVNVTAHKTCAICNNANQVQPLTAGMVGLRLHVDFGAEWENLIPCAIAKSGAETRKIILDADGIGEIPHDVLSAGKLLKIGLIGISGDGTVKIPTVWASIGTVAPSPADFEDSEPGDPYTPTEKEQVLTLAYKAEQHAKKAEQTAAKLEEDAASGRFDGAPGKDGKDGYTPVKGVDYFDGAKGDQGERGDKGDKGDKGDQGEPGKNGDPAQLDTTLTQAGMAADAKATGDKLNELKADLSQKYEKPKSGIPDTDLANGVIPAELPNPNALTFTGAATGVYDGSEPLTIDIPYAGKNEEAFEISDRFTVDSDDIASVTLSLTGYGKYSFDDIKMIYVSIGSSDGLSGAKVLQGLFSIGASTAISSTREARLFCFNFKQTDGSVWSMTFNTGGNNNALSFSSGLIRKNVGRSYVTFTNGTSFALGTSFTAYIIPFEGKGDV